MSSAMPNAQANHDNKRTKKRFNIYKGIGLVLSSLALLYYGHYVITSVVMLAAYLTHELLWSDHIFYTPRQDYIYNLNADDEQELLLRDNVVVIESGIANNATHIIKAKIKSTPSGYFLDPYIEISVQSNINGSENEGQNQPVRQYFERNLAGSRYLNVSHLCVGTAPTTLRITGHHCTIAQQLTLKSFTNPEIDNKKILVIAPHADDAELAAFGLYSQQNSFIATLTAGEIGAGFYEPLTGNKVAASRLKGRLRAWDSIMVPQWGGIEATNTLQLGYFCMTLEQMWQHQDVPVASRTADLTTTQYFRTFNSMPLRSDHDGAPTWQNLVQDLSEILQQFQPDIIVTPHPVMDPHRDHRFATMACIQAVEQTGLDAHNFLLYANHYQFTDMFPFGLSASIAALPPQFSTTSGMKVFSSPLDQQLQQDKLAAITMMHDLQTPIGAKKKLRQYMQHIFLGRDISPYGDDEYLRTAVRQNELFYHVDLAQLKQFLHQDRAN
jgi:LmbE family N-acetylglucosaminyl deacetylase